MYETISLNSISKQYVIPSIVSGKVGRLVMHFAVPLFDHRLHIALMMFRLLLHNFIKLSVSFLPSPFFSVVIFRIIAYTTFLTMNEQQLQHIFAIGQFPIIFGTCVLIPLWHAYAPEEDYLVNDKALVLQWTSYKLPSAVFSSSST